MPTQGAIGKPVKVKYTEKQLFNILDNYIDKDVINEFTSDLKNLLTNIHKKAGRYKIEATGTKQLLVGHKAVQPAPVAGQQGFQQIPAEEKQEGHVINRFATKGLDVNNEQDLAKAGVHFISGKRTGRILNGWEYKLHFSSKKRKIYKFIESEFMKELNPLIKEKREKIGFKLIKEKIKAIDKSSRKIKAAAALFTTLAIGTTLMSIFDQPIKGTTLKPEVILGTVPLFSVQMIERAKSDRKLKNRALGDVFLAHQKGNKDVLRVDATLTGPYRFIYLTFLAQLQVEGMSKKQNIGLTSDATISIAGVGDYAGELADKKVLNYDVHKTFPIITRTAILFNMYLQTIEWHQSVEDGKGVIKVHLLFRKYFPTSAFKVVDAIWSEEEGGVVIGGSSMEVVEDYGMAKRWMEFTVDAIWKMSKMMGEIFGRMLIGADWYEVHQIDRQAVSSMDKLVTSYSGKLLGII